MLAVEDLLLWRDPKKSGIAFGGATLVFLFFFFLKMPMISLILYSVGAILLIVTLWSRFGKSVGRCAALSFLWMPHILAHAS